MLLPQPPAQPQSQPQPPPSYPRRHPATTITFAFTPGGIQPRPQFSHTPGSAQPQLPYFEAAGGVILFARSPHIRINKVVNDRRRVYRQDRAFGLASVDGFLPRLSVVEPICVAKVGAWGG